MQEIEKQMGLRHKFGTVYHLQSQGKVKRINGNVKIK